MSPLKWTVMATCFPGMVSIWIRFFPGGAVSSVCMHLISLHRVPVQSISLLVGGCLDV